MLKEVERGATVNEVIDFTLETCCNCDIPFFMPSYHKRRLLANPGEAFYCPNGHCQSYVGKTEAQKLQEQLDQLRKEKEHSEQVLQNRWLDALGEKQKAEKQLSRLQKNGVCTCCHRSFINLKRHMETEHPEVVGKVKPVLTKAVKKKLAH